jgi:hypothetical protein
VSIDEAIRQAREALSRDGRGNLQLGARHAIWAALGARDESGRRVRTALAIRTSEHVRPLWKARWPKDPLPERLVELARQVLSRAVDTKHATLEADLAHNHIDALPTERADWAAGAAGYCAYGAVRCALFDEAFDPNQVDVDARDEDTQPDDKDSSFFAAFACSGGAPWDPASHSEARRAFWLWWLDEAVPAAARGTT